MSGEKERPLLKPPTLDVESPILPVPSVILTVKGPILPVRNGPPTQTPGEISENYRKGRENGMF